MMCRCTILTLELGNYIQVAPHQKVVFAANDVVLVLVNKLCQIESGLRLCYRATRASVVTVLEGQLHIFDLLIRNGSTSGHIIKHND